MEMESESVVPRDREDKRWDCGCDENVLTLHSEDSHRFVNVPETPEGGHFGRVNLMVRWIYLNFLKRENPFWGAWVVPEVERPTSAQVMISRSVSSSPALGSGLTAQSLEPVSDSVPPSLSDPPPRLLCLCLSNPFQKKPFLCNKRFPLPN